MCLGPSFPQVTRGSSDGSGKGHLCRVCVQLGNPSLLSLIRQRQCQPHPEVSSSGVLCHVAWPAEVLSARGPRSQQPSGDAGTLRALAHVCPTRHPSKVGKHLGDYRLERVTVLFMLQKDQFGVGCEVHGEGRELCQGLTEEPGTRSGLGQGCRCRGELAWELAIDSGGGADSYWGTRKWEPGRLQRYRTKLGSMCQSAVKPVY